MRIEPHAAFPATSAVESEKWVSRIVFRDPPKVTKTDLRGRQGMGAQNPRVI